MRARALRCVTAVALLTFGAASAALAQGGTVKLKPGLWRVTSQVWLDGMEVLSALDAAGARASAEILEQVRAGMSPAERAEFDRHLPPRQSAQVDTECITAADASISPQEALREALASLQQPPWTCTVSNARSGANGHSFDYRCRTPANAIAEGKARFEVLTEARYRVEFDGRSHMVDMETGRPLEPRIVVARSVTLGQWQSERCEP
jgi:hypothetical protein